MAERTKDKEDLKLESLFASEAIPDNGFSSNIVRRIRRRMWIRRLALPVAFVVGGSIAIKPLAGLVTSLIGLVSSLPGDIGIEQGLIPANVLPAGSTMMLGVMAVLAIGMIGRMLDD